MDVKAGAGGDRSGFLMLRKETHHRYRYHHHFHCLTLIPASFSGVTFKICLKKGYHGVDDFVLS